MLLALLRTMRPKQWVTKNAFIFGALVFDGKLFHLPSMAVTLLGFFLLCLVSGTVYIINDLVDLEKDRQHPTKRFRPIPAGILSKRVALGSIIGFLSLVLPLSFWLDSRFGWAMSGFLALQLIYSFYLKNIVIVDVLSIAAGFVIRVGAGVALIEVARFSPWLYVCTTLLALFMGFGKRRQERILLQNGIKNTRSILNAYNLPFLDELITIVATSTILAYALYTFSAPNLPDNHTMMLTIPFVLYGIFRYLYQIHVKDSSGDPSEVVLQDRALQSAVILWGITVVIILYWGELLG